MVRSIITVLINVVIVLATLEVCARVDDWIRFGAPPFGPYTVDRLYEFHDGVQGGKPYARYQDWQLNSLGLRGPELSAGARRVLCIGASETLGMLETPGKEYPRQLQEILRERQPGKPIDVANLSYFGLTLATADKLLPRVMQAVRPDVVVIYPSYGAYVGRRSETPPASLPPAAPTLWASLRLPDKVDNLLKAELPAGMMTALRKRQIHKYMKGRPEVLQMPADRAEFLRQDLADLVGTIRHYGAQPVLVTHATRFSDDTDPADRDYFLVSWRKFYPLFSTQALLDMETRLNATVRAFAAQQGIPLVDAATRIQGGPRNFTDHEHFTNDGAHSLALLIAPAVEPLVSEGRSALVKSDSATPVRAPNVD